MDVSMAIINLNSPNSDALQAFYRDVVQVPQVPGTPRFAAGDAMFIIDSHSEVTGKAENPARWLLNFKVNDLAGETQRLKDAGVPCIREMGRQEWGGVMSTFVDPDGNYFQLIDWPDH